MEAASKIIFDDEEDIDVQNTALQNYLMSLEAHSVKLEAKATADFNCYTIASGIIDSGASANFFTDTKKVSNALPHKSQLITANSQVCYTSHTGKTALAVGDKVVHLTALMTPNFGEDIIAVSHFTAKGNKVVFTKKNCLLAGPSYSLEEYYIVRTESKDTLYRLKPD